MRIAICDDQSEVLRVIENMLKGAALFDECDIAAFTDEKAFLDHIKNEHTDIALIDIMLSDGASGIEVARQINQISPQTGVIFISGYTEFIEDLYEAEHLYFLRKPLTAEKLIAAIEKAYIKMHGETITITRKGTVQNISQHSIVMVESDRRDLVIYLKNAEPVRYMAKLDDFEKQLNPATFVRCHKSYIVNMNHIEHLNRKEVLVKAGGGCVAVPISYRYAASVKGKILRKLGELL